MKILTKEEYNKISSLTEDILLLGMSKEGVHVLAYKTTTNGQEAIEEPCKLFLSIDNITNDLLEDVFQSPEHECVTLYGGPLAETGDTDEAFLTDKGIIVLCANSEEAAEVVKLAYALGSDASSAFHEKTMTIIIYNSENLRLSERVAVKYRIEETNETFEERPTFNQLLNIFLRTELDSLTVISEDSCGNYVDSDELLVEDYVEG